MYRMATRITKWQKATWSSVICLIVPVLFFGLWIQAFEAGKNQTERVAIFIDFFPAFLQSKSRIMLFSLGFSFLSVLLSVYGIWNSQKLGWLTNLLILTLATSLLALNIFTLL